MQQHSLKKSNDKAGCPYEFLQHTNRKGMEHILTFYIIFKYVYY